MPLLAENKRKESFLIEYFRHFFIAAARFLTLDAALD